MARFFPIVFLVGLSSIEAAGISSPTTTTATGKPGTFGAVMQLSKAHRAREHM